MGHLKKGTCVHIQFAIPFGDFCRIWKWGSTLAVMANGNEIHRFWTALQMQLHEKCQRFYMPQMQTQQNEFSWCIPNTNAIVMATCIGTSKFRWMKMLVQVGHPTTWCSSMVVAPKSNEKVTVFVDLTQLNKSVRREQFLLPRLSDTIASQERSKTISEMDANSGLRKQWETRERRILIIRISLLIVRISFENSERIIRIYRASISSVLEIRLVCTNVPLWLKNNWPVFSIQKPFHVVLHAT